MREALSYLPSAGRLWLVTLILAPLILIARAQLTPAPDLAMEPVAAAELPPEWTLPPGVAVTLR